MLLPKPRGSLSANVFEAMRAMPEQEAGTITADPDDDADEAITLWALYELAYVGFEDVTDDAEWDPDLLRLRRQLEIELEARLVSRWSGHASDADIGEQVFALIEEHDGPSVARHVRGQADRDEVLEMLRWRSIYHLKEADPTTWVVPRLPVAAKAALMELQYDEYGGGNPNQLHAHLFARGLEAVGLRSDYGAYVDDVPVAVLEQNNVMSLFGLHRRWRGAAMGHLAAFEATSSVPSRRLAQGLDRLGFDPTMSGYYSEHVTADAVHDQLAARVVCGSLAAAEPALRDDIMFGAFTCLDLEERFARELLGRWGSAHV